MIKTMIDLGLTEDDMIVMVNVKMEMTTIGNDDIVDIGMETERGGKRLMRNERKGGGREGSGMIGIVIGPGSLILEKGLRGPAVGSEI